MNEPDFIWDESEYDSPDEAMFAHADMMDELTVFMKSINEDGDWHAVVNNFGWRSIDGFKDFTAHNGVDLLHEILPRTQCTYKIWMDKESSRIVVDNAHHDKPTGGEMYYITPRKEKDGS